MVKKAYISEYKTVCYTTPYCISETLFVTEEDPYVAEYHVIDNDKKKGKCILMNYQSNAYNGGKYSVMKYIKGSMVVSGKKEKYFAFYFEGYDNSNLIDISKVQEQKDVSKFTWCVEHTIGETTKTVEELAALAKKIKAKYLDKKHKSNSMILEQLSIFK